MAIVVGIVVVLALAVVALLVSGRRHSTTGRLSRETQKRDTTAGGSAVPAEAAPEGEESVAALSGDARSRADDARRAIESGDSPVPDATGSVPATTAQRRRSGTSRSTRTRSASAAVSSSTGRSSRRPASASARSVSPRIAFLWPSAVGGAGTKITVGSEADAKAAFDNKEPFYNAGAKTYIVAYPKQDLPKAKKIPAYARCFAGHGAGLRRAVPEVRAPRVPRAVVRRARSGSSAPATARSTTGSARSAVARRPAASTGSCSRSPAATSSSTPATIIVGPPIGTDTTGQSPEGAPCV